ncbi:MAG: type II secretion system protein [Chthoniobacterales bacterium]
MKHLPDRGFTLIELLVVISIIAILAGLALPAIAGAMTKGQLIQTVNNGRQLQQLTMSASLDANVTGDTNIIGWPGNSNGITLNTWLQTLTNTTITGNVLAKLFTAPGVTPAWVAGTGLSGTKVSSFFVYPVTDTSTPDTIFLTTANWKFQATPPALVDGTTPYGTKGFVVVHQGGDAISYSSSKQATNAPAFYGNTNVLTPINPSAPGL